jgi:hypothetical protein
MVPFAVKANTACRHNATGIMGGSPPHKARRFWPRSRGVPARDRMSCVAEPGTRRGIIFLQTVQLTCANACLGTG